MEVFSVLFLTKDTLVINQTSGTTRVNIHPVYSPHTPHTSLCKLFMVQGPRLGISVLQHAGFWVFRGQLTSYSCLHGACSSPLLSKASDLCRSVFPFNISIVFVLFSWSRVAVVMISTVLTEQTCSESSYHPQGGRDQFELGMQVWPSWLINHSPSTLPQCRNTFSHTNLSSKTQNPLL